MSLAKSWDALRLTVTCQRSEKPELARRLLAALLVSWAGDGGLDGLDVRANEDALRSGFASADTEADTDLLGMQSGGQRSTSPAGTGKDLFLSCRGMASASTASPGIPLSVNRPTKLMSTYPSVALGVGGQMRRCPGHRAEPPGSGGSTGKGTVQSTGSLVEASSSVCPYAALPITRAAKFGSAPK
jgi:hypothetical protein